MAKHQSSKHTAANLTKATIPIPVKRELAAIEIKLNDPSYLENRTIHVKGSHLNLFGGNTFKGMLIVSGYPMIRQIFSIYPG